MKPKKFNELVSAAATKYVRATRPDDTIQAQYDLVARVTEIVDVSEYTDEHGNRLPFGTEPPDVDIPKILERLHAAEGAIVTVIQALEDL